jgi:hypothetical protein
MKTIKTILATLAVVALAGSALAIQTQTVQVSDNGGGISITPVTSTSGVVTYSGSDSYWSLVISTATSYPPQSGGGTLGAPVMDLSITATSTSADSSANPLTITFTSTGFGPTTGMFEDTMSGHTVFGTGATVTFSTDYSTANATPATTALTSVGTMPGPSYLGSWSSSVVSLAAPYSLSEVVTIAGAPSDSYSLDGNLYTVPDGGVTAILLGAALSALGLIRRKLA